MDAQIHGIITYVAVNVGWWSVGFGVIAFILIQRAIGPKS